jgi:hypothetical protein
MDENETEDEETEDEVKRRLMRGLLFVICQREREGLGNPTCVSSPGMTKTTTIARRRKA